MLGQFTKAAIEGSLVVLLAWTILQLIPSCKPAVRSWVWRLVFLKFVLGLVTVPALLLPVLPSESPATPTQNAPRIVRPSVQESDKSTLAAPDVKPVNSVTVDTLAVSAWVLGVSCLLLLTAVGHARSLKLRASAQPVADPRAIQLLEELSVASNIHRSPELLSSPNVLSPMLIGGFRPKILIPDAYLSEESRHDLKLVLAHELAHLARHDIAWDLGARAVQCAFFFCPTVWLAAWESNLARESAADELALQISGASAHGYAEMLYRATVQLPVRSPLAFSREPGVLGMMESHRALERRLKAMKNFSTKSNIRKSSVSLLVLGLTVALLPAYELTTKDWKARQQAAQLNVKQLVIATEMYAADFDFTLPNVQSKRGLMYALWPYTKSLQIFETENPNKDQFQLAPNLAGTVIGTTPTRGNPGDMFAEAKGLPLYVETGTWPDGKRWVGYVGGSVALLDPAQFAKVTEALKIKHKVVAGPLPADYGKDWNPAGKNSWADGLHH